MRSLSFLLLLVLAACEKATVATAPRTASPVAAAKPSKPTAPAPDLDYVVRRVYRPEGRGALVVELTFQGSGDGRSHLKLPDAWAGEKDLHKDLKGLEVTSPGARIEAGKEPWLPSVVHPPGAKVSIRYELSQQPELESVEEQHAYRVLVQKDYVHAIGHGLWVTPADLEKKDCSIRIRWEGFPEGSTIANSFGTGETEQTFTETIPHLRHAVFLAGDFRLHDVSIRGKKVSVALRGKWGFQDRELVDLVARVVDVERAFFQDDDFDRFLVSLIPTGKGCCSYGGTGLTDSFATFVTSDLPIERRMIHLLSHELFHTWNGRRIGRQQPEELVYWFSEGFTDYYSELLSFRAGLISFADYIDSVNSTLRQYHLSPAKNAANEEIAERFWTERAIERLPYQRGQLLAILWNDRIRAEKNGASLDDVMRDLFTAARDKGTLVSAESIDGLMRPYLSDGIAADTSRYVDKGETVPSPAAAFGPCVRLTHTSIGPFTLGFDEKATDAAGRVTGVVRGSAAERAGVRDGMKLARSKWSSDPTRPVTLTVVDGERERIIEYLPQGKPVRVPQYRIDEEAYAKDRAACEAPVR